MTASESLFRRGHQLHQVSSSISSLYIVLVKNYVYIMLEDLIFTEVIGFSMLKHARNEEELAVFSRK